MGFVDSKNDIFDKIGTFKVISGLPKKPKLNSFGSVSSKSKNLMPFMTDLLGSTCSDNSSTFNNKSRCNTTTILKDMLNDSLPVIDSKVREGLVDAIKSGLVCGTDFTIPNPTPTMLVDVNQVDLNGMMKTDPNSNGGNLVFGNSNKDFNRFLYDVISTQSSNTWKDNNGTPLLDINFNSVTQKLGLTISSVRAGTSFHTFLVDYTNSIELFPKKQTTAKLTDQLFGTLSGQLNISSDIVENDTKVDVGIDKILDSDLTDERFLLDDSFYEFTDDELLYINQQGRDKSRGVNVIDLGCGLVEVYIPISILSELDNIETSSPKLVKDIIDRTIDNIGNKASEFGSDEDSETIKMGFGLNGILTTPKVLTKMGMTPSVVALYQISNQTVNGTSLDVRNGYEFSRKAKTFFVSLVKVIYSTILAILFFKIKREILSLIERVVGKIIKEKIKLFMLAITSVLLIKNAGKVSQLLTNPNVTKFI